MKTTIYTNAQRIGCLMASVIISSLLTVMKPATTGIIDLDIDEHASTIFKMYYHDGTTTIPTDYNGFQEEKYPLRTGSQTTYLITDTLSLMSQQEAGVSFTFNGQGLQTIRLELIDMDDNTIWSFCDDNLYSGTQAKNGQVPHKTVRATDIPINIEGGKFPDLCRLRISAVAGKETYKLHLHAINMYSANLPWEKCHIALASEPLASDDNIYLTWISLNGAKSYQVIMTPGTEEASNTGIEPTIIPVPATNNATHHATLPLADYKSVSYRIEAAIDGHTVTSPTWSHTTTAGIESAPGSHSAIISKPDGIIATSSSDGTIEVYSIAGIRLAVQNITCGVPSEINLPAGIYIVRFPDVTLKATVRK